MFNILGSSYRSTTSRRDDHGVGELLAAVSQRSSCNDHERQELREMAQRVRTSKLHQTTAKKAKEKAAQESPSSSTHGSSSDGSDISFNHDTTPSSKVDLLRGFGPSSSNSGSSLDATSIAHQDFGHSERDGDDGDDDRSCDSYGY